MHPTIRRAPFDLAFLSEISYVQAVFHFQADGPIDLLPFGGSTLRGIFGRAFRRHLCTGQLCEEDCLHPEDCRYYSLFERDRESPGKGPSLPKPYILDPPVHPQLERIAAGAPVHPPFAVDRLPGRLPNLRNLDATPIASAAPPVGHGKLHLVRVTDPVGGLRYTIATWPTCPSKRPSPGPSLRGSTIPAPRRPDSRFLF